MSISRKISTLGVTAALAALGSAGAAHAGTFICVPPQAGVAVVSGGPNGTCDSVSTPVQLPSAAVDQKTLIDILPYISFKASGIGSKPTITFKGVNVQVTKANTAYNAPADGTGNLVVGAADNARQHPRTGSENLVVGTRHGWTSSLNIIGGADNVAGGDGFGVAFGMLNRLEAGGMNAVLGGEGNTAAGGRATVAGGYRKTASTLRQLVADGAPDMHWVKLSATGTVLDSSAPDAWGGNWGTGRYWAGFPKINLTKCAVTATVKRDWQATPVMTHVYWTYPEYTMIEVKQITNNSWPVAYEHSNAEIMIKFDCGRTSSS
jgi:hypothetical protein